MASTGEVWKLGHRPALDGLRGIAVLLVVVGHGWQTPLLAAGSTGVGVFFALSGFLITALLLEERDRTAAISLRAFYVRRARRLLPALYVFLAATLLAAPLLGSQDPVALLAVLLYVGNWLPALFGYDLGLAVGHTWSLAVEEQFYLLWPLLLLAAGRLSERALLRWCLAGFAASTLWRVALFASEPVARSYAGTDTNAAGLLIGAAVAVAARQYRWTPPRSAVVAVSGGIGALALAGDTLGGWLVAPALAPALAAVVILAVARDVELRVLDARWVRLVGRRSYAVYLWQMPMLMVVAPALPGPRSPAVVTMIAATWGLACLSWRFVEQPFQRARSRERLDLGAVPPALDRSGLNR